MFYLPHIRHFLFIFLCVNATHRKLRRLTVINFFTIFSLLVFISSQIMKGHKLYNTYITRQTTRSKNNDFVEIAEKFVNSGNGIFFNGKIIPSLWMLMKICFYYIWNCYIVLWWNSVNRCRYPKVKKKEDCSQIYHSVWYPFIYRLLLNLVSFVLFHIFLLAIQYSLNILLQSVRSRRNKKKKRFCRTLNQLLWKLLLYFYLYMLLLNVVLFF